MSGCSAERIAWFGHDGILAQTDELEMVIVPGLGSQVTALRSKRFGLPLLREPASLRQYADSPVLFGIPILFPPNRIADGTFTYGGRTYRFDINEPEKHNFIHGFVHERPWDVADMRVEGEAVIVSTLFDAARFPDVMRQFPHPFLIRMTFRLEGARLTMDANIENAGTEEFPWGLGYHTTFRYPFRPEGSLERCKVQVSIGERWELDERLLPTGRLASCVLGESVRKSMFMDGVDLDDVFLAAPSAEDGKNRAVLTDLYAGVEVEYECDGHWKQWVLHNRTEGERYLCPEPYTWVTNAPNVPLPPDMTGLQTLKPGETKRLRTVITVRAASGGNVGNVSS
ncbi:aldose 1-epimerase [Paenibacillus sp. MSJ-34]|uniref:aldose 1-epimerase n=1 Tax=Paenibacillus sp. MSJ-34 TaxID=2841529 RepID=UPI001C125ACD|nr:aldose 1-epimerase [Paenibacillus sp. MSJ-34]MBU5445573.1 aldose 1-epimerase [Paenibacillus sp. MSJ-34]